MVSQRLGPRYPSIPAFGTHAVGREFPFPQFRAISSRSLNAIVMEHA
ncbi:hypothetical protein PITC_096140 [Penicillium italicum]|uniref:Uncharacterized protein n=1 Tax=Penicillium italicum TaxID=40296 RepID=A0A0A2KQN7_PENIT|nr:hypothetical protein PITC_096140 [Penicillium italicum]